MRYLGRDPIPQLLVSRFRTNFEICSGFPDSRRALNDMSESEWLNEEASFDLLKRIFPIGLQSTDLLTALCPQGWQNSSLKPLLGGGSETDQQEAAIANLRYLVGLCLWDILSDNHDLLLPDGRVVYLGSFRVAAGIISDFAAGERSIDFRSGEDYLDFYMGTWAIRNRNALKPIYRHIFSRLRECGVDWKYSFPRLQVIRLELPEEQAGKNFESYDPSASFAAEQKAQAENEQYVRMQEELEKLHQESIELARTKPPKGFDLVCDKPSVLPSATEKADLAKQRHIPNFD
jgi:hypothetical protein